MTYSASECTHWKQEIVMRRHYRHSVGVAMARWMNPISFDFSFNSPICLLLMMLVCHVEMSLSKDSEPLIAPDGQASTLRGSWLQ